MSAAGERVGRVENGSVPPGKSKSLRFNGIYEAPIDNLGWPGRLIRHKFLDAILFGSPLLVQIQKFRKPWLDVLMHVLSFMGTEDFYTGIIVLLTWIFDLRFSRLFTILMGTAFYCTTALKNVLRLPRPPSPPVAVLETTYDWSFPSLHAFIGISLPGYLFFYPFKNYDLSTDELTILAISIVAWTTCVCASRLYLGVHSPADILFGLCCGSVLLYAFLQIDDTLDAFLQESHYTSLQALVFYMLVLAIHPQSGPPTHSFGETAVTCGVAYGMIVGFERIRGPEEWYYAALLEQRHARMMSTAQLVGLSVGRVIIGFPAVLTIRAMAKPVCRRVLFVFCHWLGVPCYSYSEFSKSCVQLNKHYCSGYKLPPVYKKDMSDEDLNNSHKLPNGSDYLLDEEDNDKTHSKKTKAVMGSWPWAEKIGRGSQVTLPLDIDNPTKFIVYSLMSWSAIEVLDVIFFHTGLVAHSL